MKLIIGYMPAFGVGVMDRDYMYCIFFLIYQLVDSFRRHPVAGVQFSLETQQGMALVGMPPRMGGMPTRVMPYGASNEN